MKYILLFLSLSVFAEVSSTNGNGVGNGGDVVVCKNRVELLDFAEEQKIQISSRPYKEQISEKLRMLKVLDEKLSNQYLRVFTRIDDRIKFIDKANFRDVSDSFEISIPKDCSLKQLAIQQEVEGNKHIHISKELWDQLDSTNKAGLIMHEMIYEHFVLLGEKDSLKVRKFNAFLFSEDIKKISKADYQSYLRKINLKMY